MKDLEKTLDLDSFGQVPFKLSQQSAIGTSTAGTSQQPPQETNILATGTSKGKGIETTKQPTMTNQPGMSKEQSQVQIPLAQTRAAKIPALQTPLNEERNKKRDRETTTPISGSTEQPGAKRQRLNPLSKEETIEETVDSQREERARQLTFTLRKHLLAHKFKS